MWRRRQRGLFTVISILVLVAIVAHDLAAAPVREPAATLFDGFDHFGGVATAAAQRGTVVREAAAAARYGAERRRRLEVVQLVVGGVLKWVWLVWLVDGV